MSNFLELCQRTAREAGIAGIGPSTTLGQTGELANVVRWVQSAYREIQNRHGGHWRFLRHGFTLDTVADTDTYAFTAATDSTTASAITRFSSWRFQDRIKPPTIFLTSAGSGTQTWMIFAKWEPFGQIYQFSNQIPAYPAHITIKFTDEIVLGPIPNDIYTVTGEYWRSAQELAADDEVPEMPIQFHDLIVWYAIEHYGYNEAAAESLAHAEVMQRKYMRQLEANQIERFGRARPLA